MYYGRYLESDKNDDGSPYLPFNDKYMTYDFTTKKYTLTDTAIRTLLNINIEAQYEGVKVEQFLAEQRDNTYRELLKSPYQPIHKDIVKFKIGRTEQGRDGIRETMLSQVKWVLRFDKDFDEDGISPNAKTDLLEYQLWHRGSYGVRIDPAEFEVGY